MSLLIKSNPTSEVGSALVGNAQLGQVGNFAPIPVNPIPPTVFNPSSLKVLWLPNIFKRLGYQK